MNVLFASRLPSLPGLGMGLAVAVLWLGRCDMRGVQSSFGNVDAPAPGAPLEAPWPAVDWGIEPALPGAERLGWPAGKVSIPSLKSEAEAVVLALRSAKGDVVLNFGVHHDVGLGPVVSVVAPAAAEVQMTGPKGREAGPMRLGNVTFNQTASSLNAWESGATKGSDLSRQFQTEIIIPNVVQSSPISGWALAALAAIAVIIAMAIGYYENDRDDRKRRKTSRKSRRRHRPAS